MKKQLKSIALFSLVFIINVSCSSNNEQDTEATLEPPTAAKLIYPENNTECNEGIVVSDTETDVLFQWEQATNASSYVLTITNLNNGSSRDIKTTSNEFLIRVLRGTPYSWVVKSIVGYSSETADSETWKFYNAGLPEESHPPFPAEIVSPQIGTSINAGNIVLQWEAIDIDNDIASYIVLLDTNSTPVTQVGNPSVNNLNITLSSEQVYYWKVITIDELGNESHSQICQFRVK